ncbi:hypothetical protein B0I35DRAFT_452053 [Stachybotrys elegans]|uniref:NAD(P)-binding protein n=1 Tax=Stachybotrys elegans TaxID=80388 RepID=A0A8K0SNV1_9HYPO|nr:hypothetical protein B0I35DRAFT_452053 [Stachybotrys elegans]
MDVMLKISVEQLTKVPMLASESTCSGKTYIVTGSNTGLGLETARHLVNFTAARVILAVRNLAAGEKAKQDIEKSTGRQGVVEVWQLDMASYASIQAFAKKASAEVERIDGFVANAGVMVDKWQLVEGMEITIFVNVIGTVFLAALMLPQLVASGRKYDTHPTFAFVGSALSYSAKGEVDKSRTGGFFNGFNDQKRASLAQRYSLSKLVEECAARQFAALCLVEQTGVVMNIVAPGMCWTGLGRDTGSVTKAVLAGLRATGARTPEVGSRVIVSGLVMGDESHGKLISGSKIKEHWQPTWFSNAEGQQLQKDIWKELVDILETVQPGCISQLS